MNNVIRCPNCGKPVGIVISTHEPFYRCECGYDSRNYKIEIVHNSTNFIELGLGYDGLGVTAQFCRMEVPEGMNVYCAKKVILGDGWDARSLPLAVCRAAIKSA
jgi:ssDNA-binding Zn-finger/Zn-ribbon topoisomerase 1